MTPATADFFENLLEGNGFVSTGKELSDRLELLAHRLLGPLHPGSFDGLVELTVHRRKARQLDFTGQMWILGGKTEGGSDTSFLEPFHARVTDMRSTKQGSR